MTGVDAATAEVWERLAGVIDPELDEAVTELGFVTGVEIDDAARVHIGFRLPTYWCAANFSFMMADDMRAAVGALPWVRGVRVTLGEHMDAERINAGLARGLSFEETFGAEATGNLDDLRRTFLLKAFQRRQVALLDHLLAAGHAPDELVRLDLAALRALRVEPEGEKLVRRYLERRALAGSADPGDPAFVTVEGAPLSDGGFADHLAGLRRVRVNAEFNGALCRGLLAARFDMTTPLSSAA